MVESAWNITREKRDRSERPPEATPYGVPLHSAISLGSDRGVRSPDRPAQVGICISSYRLKYTSINPSPFINTDLSGKVSPSFEQLHKW